MLKLSNLRYQQYILIINTKYNYLNINDTNKRMFDKQKY